MLGTRQVRVAENQCHQVGGPQEALTSCLPPKLIEGKAEMKYKPYGQILFFQ